MEINVKLTEQVSEFTYVWNIISKLIKNSDKSTAT
jgi:hypothetical protein